MVKGQPTSRQEIENLLGIVERDRSQAHLEGLHLDIKFELLYNAALQLATIVLRLNELRAGQTGRHKETFRSVQELVPKNLLPIVLHFDQARRKRNTLVYDQAGTATEADLKGLRASVSVFEKWARDLVISHFG